jgi:hypothetical protein
MWSAFVSGKMVAMMKFLSQGIGIQAWSSQADLLGTGTELKWQSAPEEFNAAGLIVPEPSFIPPMPLTGVATWWVVEYMDMATDHSSAAACTP